MDTEPNGPNNSITQALDSLGALSAEERDYVIKFLTMMAPGHDQPVTSVFKTPPDNQEIRKMEISNRFSQLSTDLFIPSRDVSLDLATKAVIALKMVYPDQEEHIKESLSGKGFEELKKSVENYQSQQ